MEDACVRRSASEVRGFVGGATDNGFYLCRLPNFSTSGISYCRPVPTRHGGFGAPPCSDCSSNAGGDNHSPIYRQEGLLQLVGEDSRRKNLP